MKGFFFVTRLYLAVTDSLVDLTYDGNKQVEEQNEVEYGAEHENYIIYFTIIFEPQECEVA